MKKDITPRSEVPIPFDPDHKRYSDQPFPAYRFIPGITPHPHIQIPSGPPLKKGGDSSACRGRWPEGSEGAGWGDFLYGIDLYNFNYWWEAHEAWELVWKTIRHTDESALFLQGLIQISAGMIKWWTGNSSGMKKLFKEGIEKLQTVLTQNLMGLDLKGQIAKIRRFEENRSEENYPFIELE